MYSKNLKNLINLITNFTGFLIKNEQNIQSLGVQIDVIFLNYTFHHTNMEQILANIFGFDVALKPTLDKK